MERWGNRRVNGKYEVMFLLIFFAFLAGIVTILSPCILPILPVVLSGSVAGGKKRPFGIITGFVVSFTFFTLTLSTIVKATGIPADTFRLLSIVIIIGMGLSLLLPQFQVVLEKLFSRLANLAPKATQDGFWGGILVGLSLGLIWTPCVGPILASVISLAISGTVTGSAVFITLAYSAGTAIPMLIIVFTGRRLFQFIKNPVGIQKFFGVVMILTGLAIYLNFDRKFQTYILDVFPNYGTGLTQFENIPQIKPQLADMAVQKTAPELIAGGSWFNSLPLTLESQRGKVVLLDFWTYTCINCIRTLPYLTAWDTKYKDLGLVIIGVHSPEFEFEKSEKNVANAIRDFGIKYPVMQDNDFATWNAYSNRYWPAHYFIDKKGVIRHTHFGEGEYDQSEKIIQELLSEESDPVTGPIANPTYQITSRTPELYLGTKRRVTGYTTQTGDWSDTEEYAHPKKGATLTLKYTAKDVFLVMRPTEGPVTVRVYLDDKFSQDITVDSDRLYDIARLKTSGSHTLRLEFPEDGVQLFAFTFG